jgi:hypothetical protein
MLRYNTKNRKIINLEEKLKIQALKIADVYLNKKGDLINQSEILHKLRIKYNELEEQWLLAVFNNIVGKRKVYIKNKLHRRKIRKMEYFLWEEDFVDEDSGEVVSVERTRIIKMDGVLVDKDEKPIKFDLSGKKIENW